MQASHTGTPIVGDDGTIFVSIELSQKTWLVTLHSPDRDRMSRHWVKGGAHGELLALIDRVRARAARAMGGDPGGGELLRGWLTTGFGRTGS